ALGVHLALCCGVAQRDPTGGTDVSGARPRVALLLGARASGRGTRDAARLNSRSRTRGTRGSDAHVRARPAFWTFPRKHRGSSQGASRKRSHRSSTPRTTCHLLANPIG